MFGEVLNQFYQHRDNRAIFEDESLKFQHYSVEIKMKRLCRKTSTPYTRRPTRLWDGLAPRKSSFGRLPLVKSHILSRRED